MEDAQILRDIRDLKRLGYVQEFLREIGGFSSFAVSFSVISILTGATQLYGYGLSHGGPLQLTAGWCVVSLFTLCVALSMAELASSYPTAGASYHWSHILGGTGLGWLTASLNIIGQFSLMAGVDYGLAQFLIGLLQLPNTPMISFGLYAGLLFSHAFFNHRSTRLVAYLNDFSAWYHLAGVTLLMALLCWKGLPQSPRFLVTFHSSDGFRPWYSLIVGLLLSQWTLTGYDASAHVTEETIDPRRRAPWGIVSAVGISIVAGLLMLAIITLSIPDLNQATQFGDNAFIEIMKLRLGEKGATTVLAMVAGAMWLCGLAGMTSASRIVYAFARDQGLPYWRFWAKVSPSHKTPAQAIWGIAAFALILALSVSIYSAVVSIATIALSLSYAIPLVVRLRRRQRGRADFIGPWNLGRYSSAIAFIAVAWTVFITVVFVLPPNEQAGYVMAALLAALFILWRLFVRFRFTGPCLLTQGDAP